MTTYTARGSNTAKALGNTLVIADVAANTGDFLCIVTGGRSASPPTGVTWGLREVNKAAQRIHSTPEFTANMWTIRRVANGGTRDVTITWGSSIATKTAYAFTLDSPHVVDEIARNILTESANPTVGPTAEHLRRDNFCAGLLLAEGPTNDAVLTSITSGWTTGRRVGTVGIPPISNLTMNEFYQQCSTSSGVTLAGTATTARDWIGLIASFKLAQHYCVDYYGSIIEAGDNVSYNDTEYVVSNVYPNRNVIDLPTIGFVSAVECEVLNN